LSSGLRLGWSGYFRTHGICQEWSERVSIREEHKEVMVEEEEEEEEEEQVRALLSLGDLIAAL